jgi:hypothetical protein
LILRWVQYSTSLNAWLCHGGLDRADAGMTRVLLLVVLAERDRPPPDWRESPTVMVLRSMGSTLAHKMAFSP